MNAGQLIEWLQGVPRDAEICLPEGDHLVRAFICLISAETSGPDLPKYVVISSEEALVRRGYYVMGFRPAGKEAPSP